MIQILTTAFMLGLVFNAAPGAVFAETIKRSMSGGYREALFLQLGSLVGDALWAILGLLGIGVLLQSPAMQLPVAMAGAAYLAYLAWDSWAASNAPIQSSASHKANIKTSAKSTQSATRAGVIISATNPQNIAYWAAIGSAFGALGITQPQPLDYALFFSGFMLSSLLWCFFCAALVSKLFGKAGNKWKVITYRLCAIAFFYLACGTLYKAIANFG